MLTADLYYSFRSPYSYLAIGRYRQLMQDYDLTITLRPVYPVAIRNPGFFKTVNPLWVPYLLSDVVRVAEVDQEAIRNKIAAEQEAEEAAREAEEAARDKK